MRMTVSEITELHARYVRVKGAGFAPPLADCLKAAATGRLYEVDTQNDGDDCLAIGESESEVLSDAAAHHDCDAWAQWNGEGSYADHLRYSADRITLVTDEAVS